MQIGSLRSVPCGARFACDRIRIDNRQWFVLQCSFSQIVHTVISNNNGRMVLLQCTH